MLAAVRPIASMDPYGYGKHHSDRESIGRESHSKNSSRTHPSSTDRRQYHQQHQQRQQPPPPNQQLLPSFQEILPPPLHSAIDSSPNSRSNKLLPGEYNPQPSGPANKLPTSSLPSPNHSQSSSMPDSADDLGQKNYDSLNHYSQPRSNSTWSSSSTYPEMSTSYQRQSFYNPPFGHSKQASTLPPMREIPFHYDYVAGANQHQMCNGSPQTASGVDTGHGSMPRRPSFYSQTYPGGDRGFHGVDSGYKPSYTPVHRSPSGYYADPYSAGYGSLPSGIGYSPTVSNGNEKRRRGNLPRQTTDLLKSWLLQHIDHPYPTEEEKQYLMSQTNLNLNQISNWFINARRRHWPAMKKERMAKKDEENGLGHDSERSR